MKEWFFNVDKDKAQAQADSLNEEALRGNRFMSTCFYDYSVGAAFRTPSMTAQDQAESRGIYREKRETCAHCGKSVRGHLSVEAHLSKVPSYRPCQLI